MTRTGAKRQQLLDAGADEVIATAEEDVPARVRALTDGQGARVIFDPVGGTALADLVTAAAHEAHLVLYGVLDRTPTPLNVVSSRESAPRQGATLLPAVTRGLRHSRELFPSRASPTRCA
ncbi:zinc-binding dehydrogenase [Streptomyces sp. NPDC017890]|uniref:zinc-binding dehydrogenase n=1 Tax=Streptomyces sp. NPDC017890 TaxID=3365015 RepID=UPI003789E782